MINVTKIMLEDSICCSGSRPKFKIQFSYRAKNENIVV